MSGSETWQFFLAELSSDKKFWLLGMFTTLGISWHLSDPWMDSPPFPLGTESPHVPCNPFVTSLGLQIHPDTTLKSSHLIDVSYHNFYTFVSKIYGRLLSLIDCRISYPIAKGTNHHLAALDKLGSHAAPRGPTPNFFRGKPSSIYLQTFLL